MLIKLSRSLLPVLPETAAFRITTALAALASPPPLRAEDRLTLEHAAPFRFGPGRHKHAWLLGEGPLVVLVHGWGGRASQMLALAAAVTASGHRALVFDAAAHGASAGRAVSFSGLIRDLGELHDAVAQPVAGYVAHSAGALSLMAARRKLGLRARKYACLNAPRAPYVPIAEIEARLDPPRSVLERCRRFYAEQFGWSWEELDRGVAYGPPDDRERLLLVNDIDDARVDPADGERIAAVWGHARVVKTAGLGHMKVLWDPVVHAEVHRFLEADA